MRKVPLSELFLFEAVGIDEETRRKLLSFNRSYQTRLLRYFAELRIRFEEASPGVVFPGLFAEVDAITGELLPPERRRVWSWGDCRALGIWSYLLAKGVVPEEDVTIRGRHINLRRFYEDYCDLIFQKLLARYERNGGRFPFIVDIQSNMPSDDPRNVPCATDEREPGHIFAASGFLQYGLWRRDDRAIALGRGFLRESLECGLANRNVDHLTRKRALVHWGQGFLMVTAGAAVDALKCLLVVGREAVKSYDDIREELTGSARTIAGFILSRHCDPVTGEFWEFATEDGKPFVDAAGQVVCDPGHAAEGCGFFAELCDFLPSDATDTKWPRRRILETLVKILRFVDRHGYSSAGVMCKRFDVKTKQLIRDAVDAQGKSYVTAPWWNVRECAAAAIKLYQLTGGPDCLDIYRRARNAAYLNYPNTDIGGAMVKTLDAETLLPLPFDPATGNLDPMHCPRARERESEALASLDLQG